MIEDKLDLYVNGEKLRMVKDDKILEEGYTGLIVFQESGETTCTFINYWLWILP
jgi:hypothetical protein